jgi:hypothetical protein
MTEKIYFLIKINNLINQRSSVRNSQTFLVMMNFGLLNLDINMNCIYFKDKLITIFFLNLI